MTSTLSQTSYRRDIDGLRALAVIAVVLFHAGAFGMQGGFVGVDIFFVISGYLITSIIAGDLAEQKFSVVEFYERRIRRIVPALVVMMAMSTLVSVVILPPQQLASFGRSEAAASAFFANIAFARHTGYFAGTEAAMPLLHTWSLGVEEQFYIIWPLILAACYRAGLEQGLKALVVLLGLASLVFSEWSVAGGHSERTFYLLQSRAWELMLGAVLALGMVPRITVRWLREILCLVGLGLMAYSIIAFSPATPFPGLYAAMPCLGAVLVIHAGRRGTRPCRAF